MQTPLICKGFLRRRKTASVPAKILAALLGWRVARVAHRGVVLTPETVVGWQQILLISFFLVFILFIIFYSYINFIIYIFS